MTAKEYLMQVYRLDQMIESNNREVMQLKEACVSVSSPVGGDKVKTSSKTDALYVRCIEKAIELEQEINEETERMMELKKQVRETISTCGNVDEELVLKYRYIHGMPWEEIADKMIESVSAAKGQHARALEHIKLPVNPIII